MKLALSLETGTGTKKPGNFFLLDQYATQIKKDYYGLISTGILFKTFSV